MLALASVRNGWVRCSTLPTLSRLYQQHRAQSTFDHEHHYWQKIPQWKDVTASDFISYRWQLWNTVSNQSKLYRFLSQSMPEEIAASENELLRNIRTKGDFIEDAISAMKLAPMAIRLTPQVLSLIDWSKPLDDPIRKQFLPLKSGMVPDHSDMTLDSLHEEADSPVPGLVARYPGRALFLATSICPVYCRFCTRSYAVGGDTNTVSKKPQKPSRKRWDDILNYISEERKDLHDIVVSGGDAYYLQPEQLRYIGEKLFSIPHIHRVRFASKGLAVAPGRILDEEDAWTDTLIDLSNKGRELGKHVCLHTHINHADEITWITEQAAMKLFKRGVTVRNQSVLLKGVNNSEKALSRLIQKLAKINIQPYYIYQCDMVRGIEDLRTPLHELIDLDQKIRGTLSGFLMPSCVIDLPGGGGKRLVSTYKTYVNGKAEYEAPGLPGAKGKAIYKYSDPRPFTPEALAEFRKLQDQALQNNVTLEQEIQSPFAAQPPPLGKSPPHTPFDLHHHTKTRPRRPNQTIPRIPLSQLGPSTTSQSCFQERL